MLSRRATGSSKSVLSWIRQSSSSSSSSLSSTSSRAHEAPRPNYFSRETLYPFLVLSCITSLALNLSHARSEREKESRHLLAQISVLERVVERLNGRDQQGHTWSRMTEHEREQIERELELVGLGRGKGRESIEQEVERKALETSISWKEVLLGKKGKGFEQDVDTTDWEKVFREADEAEQKRQAPGNKEEEITAVPVQQVDGQLPRPISAPPIRSSPASQPPSTGNSAPSPYL